MADIESKIAPTAADIDAFLAEAWAKTIAKQFLRRIKLSIAISGERAAIGKIKKFAAEKV